MLTIISVKSCGFNGNIGKVKWKYQEKIKSRAPERGRGEKKFSI